MICTFPTILRDEHFEVLVVDVLALRPVYFLDLGQQVHFDRFAAVDAQHGVRVQGTLGQRLAGDDVFAIFDQQARGGRDFVFVGLAVFVRDNQSCDPPP
jgi:hypothetical protein